MFEVLASTDTSQVIGGVYFATRALKHRFAIRGDARSLWFPQLTSDPSAAQVDLGLQILAEIEAKEGRNLQALAEEEVAAYISQLSDTALRMASHSVTVDPARGRQLLQEMRKAS